MALPLLAVSLLAHLAAASVVPSHDVKALHQRNPASLERRADETFDLGWAVQDQSLFSANWTGGTGSIPIGLTPFETSLAASFSLVLECLDCRTYGNIVAEFNDDDGLNATLTFNNVGAYMDFGVFASNEGTFTIGLGRFFGNNNQKSSSLNANIGFGIDLVLQFSGEVQASGGFQMAIPDGEQVGIDINFSSDFNVSADINIFPQVDFGLLPIELSNAATNITAALVLKAEAGVGVELAGVEANANVGAHLALVQVSFGAVDTSDGTCEQALFIDAESNAGAFAQVGGRIPGHDFEVGPDVSTVFASAGTTTCLGTKSPAFSSTRADPPLTATDADDCPTALVTGTTDVTRTYAMTSCVVSAVNCPASLTQVVLVTHVEEARTVRCPVNATAVPTATTTTSDSDSSLSTSLPAKALAPSVTPVPFSTAGIVLSHVTAPTVTSLAPSLLASVVAPANATVPGVFETLSVPPPPPPPPAAAPSPPVGGVGDGRGAAKKDAAAGLRPAGLVAALMGVAMWAVLVL
ncbi:hypothetical protein QBC33DRAFT_595896 [Phialemonium atrogriseum]|uniref:Uncharacterized protein n=1 Tax=Phialemonium atrogriseum TaxID=1093897 RepID=A0AAJ0BT94_9PEZI|nr:uncharacterized protein QBC33DRAFT_595896 [Phialemonium atrogriseum]KAK1764079.1 hypothetical protein QBC33DRAFT_595896 [Phialemonium atrogriseum]